MRLYSFSNIFELAHQFFVDRRRPAVSIITVSHAREKALLMDCLAFPQVKPDHPGKYRDIQLFAKNLKLLKLQLDDKRLRPLTMVFCHFYVNDWLISLQL
jgi:hypothetical protein